MEIVENDKKYAIIVIQYKEKVKTFINYLNKFYDLNKDNKNTFVSIDYEYHKHINQLWQVCFYNKDPSKNVIFVIDSKLIDNDSMQIIIKKLYTSYIVKLFHGGDSLDFPYVFSLLKDPKLILKFLVNSIDTRFLCEFYKITKGDKKKCSIYDAMLYFKTITQEKYDELEKVNNDMGPIWKVDWNLRKISDNLLKYTIYDVILLKDLFVNIYDHYKSADMLEDLKDMRKVNILVSIKRNNIAVEYKPNIKDIAKYAVIDYYRYMII